MSLSILTYISGGATNTDPSISFGGVISTTEVTYQVLTQSSGTIAAGNVYQPIRGSGLISGDAVDYNNSATSHYNFRKEQKYTFVPLYDEGTVYNNDKIFTLRTYGVDGEHVLISNKPNIMNRGGTYSYIKISTTLVGLDAHGPGGWYLYVWDNPSNLFNDVTGDQFVSGFTVYRCVYYKNTGLVSSDIALSVPPDFPNNEYTIGFDPVGVSVTAQNNCGRNYCTNRSNFRYKYRICYITT